MHDLVTAAGSVGPCNCMEQLTTLQRAAGFITFVNVIWLLAIAGGAACAVIFFGSILKDLYNLLKGVPKWLYAGVFYATSASCLGLGWGSGDIARPYMTLVGALALGGSVGYNLAILKERPRFEVFPWLLFMIWTPIAVFGHNNMVGFLSVAALLSALGFSIVVSPLCYMIGFEDKAAVPRATGAALLILATYVGMHVLGAHAPWTSVFEGGALFLGSFVGYLGLLIMSSRFYGNKGAGHWCGMQVLTFVLGILAIYIGSVFGLESLQKIGGTFLVLWAIEKPFEIPAGSLRGYAFIGLLVSGAAYWFCWHVRTTPAIQQYFFFAS